MAGAQAQVLSAAQMSIWARVRSATALGLDAAMWRDRTLVRAWGMRRTMFLLPAGELAVYARGTHRRSAYNLKLAEERASSGRALGRLLDDILDALAEPRTREDLAQMLRDRGHRLTSKAGGGWGDSRPVPFVRVGGASLSVGFLLHAISAKEVICSGPNAGNRATYVRADRWLPHWRDLPVEEAERGLLARYLRAFGPATLADFALWVGMYVPDAKHIWSLQSDNLVQVEAAGQQAWSLRSDLQDLEEATLDEPSVRLLPFFDSFLLGHRSHLNVVDEENRKKVYRAQGWVSPVLLAGGRARGVWSHVLRGRELRVTVTPFSALPSHAKALAEEEASDLGRFLGCADVETTFA